MRRPKGSPPCLAQQRPAGPSKGLARGTWAREGEGEGALPDLPQHRPAVPTLAAQSAVRVTSSAAVHAPHRGQVRAASSSASHHPRELGLRVQETRQCPRPMPRPRQPRRPARAAHVQHSTAQHSTVQYSTAQLEDRTGQCITVG